MRQSANKIAALLLVIWSSTISAAVVSRKSVFTERSQELARAAAGHDGSFKNRLASAYQAVVALDSVESLQTLNAEQICAATAKAISDDIQLDTAYYATQVLNHLRCLDQRASSAAATVAMQQLSSADSVQSAYQSISILSTLHKAKSLPHRIAADQIERIINLFKELSDSQGRFKPFSSSPRRSILATGLVYRTLADARSLEVPLSSETEGTVEEIRASLAEVLKGGKAGQATLALPADEDKLQAAAQLIIGAHAIYDGSVTAISGSQLSSAAQLLGAAYHVSSLADAAAVGPALKALVESELPQPLAATLASPRITGSQQDSVVITVRDAWGSPTPAGSVTVNSSAVDATGKGRATSSAPQTLQAGSSTGEYLYSTADLHASPGIYKLAVRVEDPSGLCAGESELSLTVSREVQLESVTLAFSEGEIQDAVNETLPYPQALATQSATLDPTQTLKVSLAMSASHSGSSFVPQQRMLRFMSHKTKTAAYFNLKPSKVREQTYTITITPNTVEKQIGSQDGTYSMDLLIGDSAIDVPIQWALGAVAISHQAGDDSSQSSLTAINALFQPKPEIVHLQRVSGRRPPRAVSVLFTALALAPLGLLFYMLSSVGANLKGFPKSGPAFVAAVAFHGGIASILALYTLFWLKLNLIQTLPILLVLGIFTTIAGYNALSQQADSRFKQQ